MTDRPKAMLRELKRLKQLLTTRQLQVGHGIYRTRGFFPNLLALQRREPEPWIEAVYKAALKRDGAFLDIGANIGQTMLEVLALDPGRQYVGFEPQVSCCALIQSFIEENDLSSHTIVPFGLSNKNEVVKLYVRAANVTTASMVEGFRPDAFYSGSRNVYVRQGDELIAELGIGSIAAIKVDVEGAELEVLEGLTQTLLEHQPVVIFEVLNHYLAITRQKLDSETIRFREQRIERMEQLFSSLGYAVYQVCPGNILKPVPKIQPAASADLSATNYVAICCSDFLSAFAGTVQVKP